METNVMILLLAIMLMLWIVPAIYYFNKYRWIAYFVKQDGMKDKRWRYQRNLAMVMFAVMFLEIFVWIYFPPIQNLVWGSDAFYITIVKMVAIWSIPQALFCWVAHRSYWLIMYKHIMKKQDSARS